MFGWRADPPLSLRDISPQRGERRSRSAGREKASRSRGESLSVPPTFCGDANLYSPLPLWGDVVLYSPLPPLGGDAEGRGGSGLALEPAELLLTALGLR